MSQDVDVTDQPGQDPSVPPSTPSPPPPAPAYPASAYPAPAYPAQPAATSPDTVALPWGGAPASTPETDGTAVLALVLSILSWVLLPVILAIVALVLAGSASRQIEASGGARSGQGLVTATRWIAWINLLLAAMVVAFIAAFVVALAIAG